MQFDEYSRSLEEYPLHLVNIARWREEVIRPLLSVRPLTRSIVTQRVLEVKASLQSQRAGERMLAVSIASIYRWIRAFQRSNGDLRSLIPYVRQGEDRARSRLHPAVDEIIEKAIREMYGKGECVTIDTLQHAVALLLREAKHTRLDYEQLHIPSRSTIYRRMKAGITKQGEVVDHLSSIRREYPLGTPAVDHTIFKQAEARLQHIPAAALKRGDEALSCLSAQHSCDQKVACWMCDSPARQEMLSVEPPLSNRLLLSAQHSHGTTRERKNDVADEPIHQEAALDPKQWRTMTDLKRCALIQRIKIKHHRLQPLITELDTCAYFAEKTNTREPQCLAIVGDIGVGKTTLVQSWIQTATMRWGTGSEEEKLTLPYLYTCLPALSTPKSILAACLSTLGDPRAIQGSEWTMMSRLQRLVLASSTRMLFIDEFQHLINPETRRIRLACIEILEQLITQVGVSVIFLGSQAETEAILRASPRLERLVGTPRVLHPFEWKRDKPETILEFRSLMRAIDQHLPFDLSGLDEEKMAYSFFCASNGILGWVMRLIRYAAREAISTQAATLSRSLLASANDACITNTTVGVGKINPFASSALSQEKEGGASSYTHPFPYALKHERKRTVKRKAERKW